jgi:hypothetical protein
VQKGHAGLLMGTKWELKRALSFTSTISRDSPEFISSTVPKWHVSVVFPPEAVQLVIA